jgi:hypothetical protein
VTDAIAPEVDETAEAEYVYVKHAIFTYRVPVLDAGGEQVVVQRRGGERKKFRTVHKRRFEGIDLTDIPQDELDRGEAMGAFFTDAEVAERLGLNEVKDAEAAESGSIEVPSELDFDDHDALVLWIKVQKPTAAAVVNAAGNDSDKAEALLAAEVEATGDQPRKSVKEPLEKIIQGG